MNDKLQAIHSKAMIDFSAIQAAQKDVRQQCMDDRRFCSVTGAQWEGNLAAQYENRPRFELNMGQLAVIRVFSDYRNNRITANFEPADGSKSDALADSCNDLYRAAEQISGADEAYDNAFDEGVTGGIGAWRLCTEYEDEYDEENDFQKIKIEPIFDADISVWFDLDAKRQDKSDAKYCFVLSSMTPDAYREEYEEEPVSLPKLINGTQFDWATSEVVYVAEYYLIEDGKDVLYTYKFLDGSEETVSQSELDGDPSIQEHYDLISARRTRTRKIKTRRVHKYILSGGGILEDQGIIAGSNIPIVPFYGKRWYVDNIERCMGHIRLYKDVQRLLNMQVTKLAEVSAYGSIQKPIVTPEQMAGHSEMWRTDNINNYPYLFLNPVLDANGNEQPAGPVGYTQAPDIPPALAALIQFTDQSIKALLGNPEAGEKIVSNISDDAIRLVQDRLDMQTFIYMSNFAKSVKRSGEIWLSMAKEIYVEEARKIRGITSQNTPRPIELMRPKTDPKTGALYYENDFRRAKMEIVVEVGPSSNTKRESIVRALSKMISLTADPDTQQVLTSMFMMNMEGEGVADARNYFRKKLVGLGVIPPTDEEKAAMDEAAKNQQPSPQDQFLQASAQKEAMLAEKAKADTEKAMAGAENLRADSIVKLEGIDVQRTQQLLDTVDRLA